MVEGIMAERAGCGAQVIHGRAALAGYADRLVELHEAAASPVPARWAATQVWLRHHPQAEPLAVLVGDGAGGLAGAAVLAVQHRLGWTKVTKAGEPGEPTRLAARDTAAATRLGTAVAAAVRALDHPWYLRLTDLPEADPATAALRAGLPLAGVQAGPLTPRLRLSRGAQLDAHLSPNTRSALAKARNRIAREGHRLEESWTADAARIETLLPEVVDVHRRRNRQLRGHAAFDDPARAAEFADLVAAHGRLGVARLLSVRLDGALAAFAVCLAGGGGLSVYANLVSPDWLRYSAGRLANAAVVRMGLAEPEVRWVDWGSGVQRFKLSGPVSLVGSRHLHGWSSRAVRMAWAVRRGGAAQDALE